MRSAPNVKTDCSSAVGLVYSSVECGMTPMCEVPQTQSLGVTHCTYLSCTACHAKQAAHFTPHLCMVTRSPSVIFVKALLRIYHQPLSSTSYGTSEPPITTATANSKVGTLP